MSAEGIKTCRERQIEASADANQNELREAYRSCLKTIDAELLQQAKQNSHQRNFEAEQAQRSVEQQLKSTASAEARYSHCRMVQDQVIAAENQRRNSLSLALLAARRFGADSSQAVEANATLNEAIDNLGRLIPEPMRAGEPLIPDAVRIYQRCDPADFSGR